MAQRVDMTWAGRPLILESGKMAKQADGAVVVQMGDTIVLVTAVTAKQRIQTLRSLHLIEQQQHTSSRRLQMTKLIAIAAAAIARAAAPAASAVIVLKSRIAFLPC